MEKKILEKVSLQFKGEIRTLEGEDAQRWYDATDSIAAIAYIHGQTFPELDWRITERKPYDAKRKRKTVKRSKKS